jgi:hypothetical protein
VTFSTCSGSEKAREYWFELLLAFLAIAGMLELAVGRDAAASLVRPPRTRTVEARCKGARGAAATGVCLTSRWARRLHPPRSRLALAHQAG